MPASVTLKHRKSWLLAASALVPLSLGISELALAQTCTPAQPNPDPATGNASCTGTFNSNINFNTGNGSGGTPINLTLLPGVIVNSPGGDAVTAANTTGVTAGSANITITADDVTIHNTANPLTPNSNNTGLRIQSSGDAIVNATNTTIDVNGTASNWAILVFAHPNEMGASHAASVTWSGPQLTTGNTVFGGGNESGGIQANNRGIGNATIVASGNIAVTPGVGFSGVYGLIAHTGAGYEIGAPIEAGDASVTYHSGTINAFGAKARGIVVWATGDGSGTLTTDSGTVIIDSGTNTGNSGEIPTLPVSAALSIQLDSATAANGRAITANVASQIVSFGRPTPDLNFFNNPTGIRTISYADAPTTVNYTGPGITTHGGGGVGIMALSASGSIVVNSSGPIDTTNGSNAVGILADSGTLVSRSAGLPTDTQKIHDPVPATSITGPVQVNVTNNVFANGEFGTGISATSGIGGVTVNVLSGSVMGGWQADLTSVGPVFNLQAAGVILGSSVGTATLTNNGSIGALSDRAVASSPLFPSNNTSIINNGTITGFVQLVGGNNSIVNNDLFNLRHFADTTGGGRDTLRVAIADLGAGLNNSFTNNGTLALPAVTGATTLDSTGQYLPLGNLNNAMALNGPLQGHLIGLSTFTNSGALIARRGLSGLTCLAGLVSARSGSPR
jgi:hypothetical protein